MDFELLKMIIAKSSSIEEARQFMHDFGIRSRTEIKNAELAMQYGANVSPRKPATPAKPEKPEKLEVSGTPDLPVDLSDIRAAVLKRKVRVYTKASTGENPPAKSGRRWDRHDVAALARALLPLTPGGGLPAEELAAKFQRSQQGIAMMALSIIHLETGYQAAWSDHMRQLLLDAKALAEWPSTTIPDFRKRIVNKESA